MRIQLASDLHLEFLRDRFTRGRIVTPAIKAKAVGVRHTQLWSTQHGSWIGLPEWRR